ncbi:unnamed protein product [Dicrocoelium dendriticum]|nr:unnamed protein product [Dicrocoelium dendriticum]
MLRVYVLAKLSIFTDVFCRLFSPCLVGFRALFKHVPSTKHGHSAWRSGVEHFSSPLPSSPEIATGLTDLAVDTVGLDNASGRATLNVSRDGDSPSSELTRSTQSSDISDRDRVGVSNSPDTVVFSRSSTRSLNRHIMISEARRRHQTHDIGDGIAPTFSDTSQPPVTRQLSSTELSPALSSSACESPSSVTPASNLTAPDGFVGPLLSATTSSTTVSPTHMMHTTVDTPSNVNEALSVPSSDPTEPVDTNVAPSTPPNCPVDASDSTKVDLALTHLKLHQLQQDVLQLEKAIQANRTSFKKRQRMLPLRHQLMIRSDLTDFGVTFVLLATVQKLALPYWCSLLMYQLTNFRYVKDNGALTTSYMCNAWHPTVDYQMPGYRALTRSALLDKIIRVDHAGETGARKIYEGQLFVLGKSNVAPIIKEMCDQEEHHLRKFQELIPRYRVRPTALLPFWNLAGLLVGIGSAALGPRYAMACTVAVESVISEHYNNQIRSLVEQDPKGSEELLQVMCDRPLRRLSFS